MQSCTQTEQMWRNKPQSLQYTLSWVCCCVWNYLRTQLLNLPACSVIQLPACPATSIPLPVLKRLKSWGDLSHVCFHRYCSLTLHFISPCDDRLRSCGRESQCVSPLCLWRCSLHTRLRSRRVNQCIVQEDSGWYKVWSHVWLYRQWSFAIAWWSRRHRLLCGEPQLCSVRHPVGQLIGHYYILATVGWRSLCTFSVRCIISLKK